MQIKKILVPFFTLFLLLGAISVTVFVFRKEPSTDSRSKAAPQSLSFILERQENTANQIVDVSLRKDATSQDKIHSFSLTLRLEQSHVLGLITESTSSSKSAAKKPRRTPHPATSEVEAVRCYNQVTEGKYWANTCKGIPGGTNCQPGKIDLSPKEIAWYATWTTHGKPILDICVTQSVTTSPAANISAPFLSLYDKEGVTISTTKGSFIEFDEPRFSTDPQIGIMLATISGKVRTPQDAKAQESLITSPVVQVSLAKSFFPGPIKTSIHKQSLLGIPANAPGVVVDLLSLQ